MKIKTKFGMAIQVLCILCLVGTTLFILICWNKIPKEIPSHYNMAGEADAMSGKGFLFFPLIMNWLMFRAGAISAGMEYRSEDYPAKPGEGLPDSVSYDRLP